MKKAWIFTIEKTYYETDGFDEASAQEAFIEDLANNNFRFYDEEIEIDEKNEYNDS